MTGRTGTMGERAADQGAPADAPRFDDRLARRNTVLLAGAQAFGGAMMSVNISLGGLTGGYLMPEAPVLATLPVTTMVIGIAAGTIPAALFMQRYGRRPGFIGGALIGACGGLLASFAILQSLFFLMCAGTFLSGFAFAFVQQYRFAAVDTASPMFRPKAISWVLAGGIAAAVIGPQTVIYTKDLFAPIAFAGAFFAQAGLCLIAIVFLAFLKIPRPPRRVARGEGGRPILEILSEPKIALAVLCALVSYATMSLMMTAAPIAIVFCGFSTEQAALGIQWHVLAMYGPSFFTGSIVARFGARKVAAAGLFLLAAAAAIGLSGVELANFWLALILLGVGWNFAFIGATSMLTAEQRPEERGRLQAANDFLVFGSMAVASFSSGTLFATVGWNAINWTILAVVVATFAVLLAGARSGGTPRSA